MRLLSGGLLAVAAVLVLMGPWVAAKLFEGRAPARTVATFQLLALVGMLALPEVLLACFAVVSTVAVARWSGIALAVAYPGWVGWVALRTTRVTARFAMTSVSTTRPSEVDDSVRVLATTKPVAYTVGGSVVISSGLLDLLDRAERNAVLAHEFAHVRLGHHRLLLFARVAAGTLGRIVPAVRRAHASLARELEAIADQAAGESGTALARALAKAVLAGNGIAVAPALISGSERDLAYRLDRLTGDAPTPDRRVVAKWAIALLVVALLVILAVTVRPAGVATIPAAIAIGWLCRRAVR